MARFAAHLDLQQRDKPDEHLGIFCSSSSCEPKNPRSLSLRQSAVRVRLPRLKEGRQEDSPEPQAST